jgi:NADPH:quinone reductase
MRAFAVEKSGSAPALLNLPTPSDPSAILIRITFAGVNPIDYKLLSRLPADTTYPFVLGADFSGIVESVPSSEKSFRVGDRIFGMARKHGGYADLTSVAPNYATEPLARIPEGVTDEQAAALPIPGVTALGSIEWLGVTRGQRIVIMGAAGAVGGFAVQIAKTRGAHVIATVRGDSSGDAKKLGAQEVDDSKSTDVIAAIRNAHPDGVDAVLDLVNPGDAINADATILKPGGKIVSTIGAADEKFFASRNISAYNILGNANPFSTPDGLTQLARMIADGTITARITSTDPLESAAAVLDKLRTGGIRGKALLKI